ncbi:MAG: DUF6273 domain-containing protein [Lachnospiraceae bacterium]|nr:DUF6273 domain-containing protein [Lachnospiraceae bacterium]
MKCTNPSCGGEWMPPRGKSLTVCPFCQEPIAEEKKASKSLDNVADTLVYIKEQLGVDTLLGGKAYTYFADLTRNQLRDETDLIKQLCDKGALDCLKAAIGKPDTEHENAIKRALSKLPKYLQDSQLVADMLNDFAAALGWQLKKPQPAKTPQPIAHAQVSASQTEIVRAAIVKPAIGSTHKFAGIDWRVLDVKNDQALLISEKILETRAYNEKYEGITWEKCTLREYLNGEFLGKLGAVQSAIAETPNENKSNPWYGTAGGNATVDKVFLLSLDEVCRYFGDSTANLNKKGSTGSENFIDDENNKARIAKYENVNRYWWLRSPGGCTSSAANVQSGGAVRVLGYVESCHAGGLDVSLGYGGVRPALWLNL